MMRKAIEEAAAETKLEMTPMIDVTFLLLVFFLCSIQFKVLEGALRTYLPKEVGVSPSPTDAMLAKVDVRIDRLRTRADLDLADPDAYRRWRDAGGWSERQVALSLQGEPISGLAELRERLEALRDRVPPPADPDEDDPLKMNLVATPGCIYEDVVKVVDVALGARFEAITFRGIPNDA
ncbi:MAG: ExbD/TolR family protein [Planctomycetota bacterium JB042]